jgi:hypothetical protein
MSSYLLLRNNQESGPFTMEEIKGMSLKAYDLLWVVGKSAAWRYPGEIAELKSFAPPVPEQFSDSFYKKTNSENTVTDAAAKKSESSNTRENKIQRTAPYRSVYVNLPADKKQASLSTTRMISDSSLTPETGQELNNDFSDLLYKRKTTPAIWFSGKVLWVSTVLLLFGAGILTGFFISDRRNFFSTDANHPQTPSVDHPEPLNSKKEISPQLLSSGAGMNQTAIKIDSSKKTGLFPGKLLSGIGKKNLKNNINKKDTVASPVPSYSTMKPNDSLRQNAFSKTETVYEKIRAHPENYVNLVTGRYSTGLFGGISSFPVTITNNSPVMLDVIIIDIDYIQNNGKIFKTESLSVNDLEPGETLTLKAPKSPRGTKIATHIHLVNARQPDFGNSH